MNSDYASALTRSVQEVFEGLCFMLPRDSDPPLLANLAGSASSPTGVTVAVDFEGPALGTLWLTLPEDMLVPIASAMLGDDEVASQAVQRDAVRELANIVCGNLLPLVAGAHAVFDLRSPRILPAAEEVPNAAVSVTVLLEEGEVKASLQFPGSAGQGAA